MIRSAAAALAAAIGPAVAGALGEGITVAVFDHEPPTAAAPCVWLRFVTADRPDAGWLIVHEAVVLADSAMENPGAADQLGAMVDAILLMRVHGLAPAEVNARADSSVRIGEVSHPAVVVTLPLTTPEC